MAVAVLLSGGAGLRLKSAVPKQYIRVSGKMLITYCLETLMAHPMIEAVQIVAETGWREEILDDVRENGRNLKKIRGFSAPGTERQSSVFHALRDIRNQPGSFPTVLVHDAARPNLSERQITECFAALEGHEGVMPVLPVKDTVYLSEDGCKVFGLLDRSQVFAGQAPELFSFEKYYEANLRLLPEGLQKIKGSAEPAVLAGMDIIMIPGDENNFKITTRADLERFRKQFEGGEAMRGQTERMLRGKGQAGEKGR